MTWPVQAGTWTVVIMNADASAGVGVDVAVGAKTGVLLPIGLGGAGFGLLVTAGAWPSSSPDRGPLGPLGLLGLLRLPPKSPSRSARKPEPARRCRRAMGPGRDQRSDWLEMDWARAMASAPSLDQISAMLGEPREAYPDRIGDWVVASVGRTSRHAAVLLLLPVAGDQLHLTQILERTEGRWRLRGGSGGSPISLVDRRPAPDESPVSWLGETTVRALYPGESTLRVTGGRTGPGMSRIVIETESDDVVVVPDRAGWFHVILDGEEDATITARHESGALVLGLDGLPATLRFERP